MPILATSVALLHTMTAGAASAPAQQFQQWSGERLITRSVTLGELGFPATTVLDNGNSQREFYLPVPANVRLVNAGVDLKGAYLRADGGRVTVAFSVDGVPVAAHRYNEEQGDASQSVPVDAMTRASGFVRFGISWLSVLSDAVCTDQRAPGNVLKIDPATRFHYQYERGSITTLAAAWGALPLRPVLLVAGQGLSATAYDTAWRTGLALERNGRHANVVALPAVGGTVDLARTEVPAALMSVPAFAALADHSPRHIVANAAEVGAMLMLGEAGPLHADVVITDPALLQAMRAAFTALGTQVATVAPDAVATMHSLIEKNFSVQAPDAAAAQVRLVQLGGVTTIAIPAGTLAKAAMLLGTQWRPTAQGAAITVNTAQTLKPDGDSMLLSRFGAIEGSFDVMARTDRTVAFDLGAVATGGRMPDRLDIDVSAAPSINGEAPVVSVFVNDFLLAARQVVADGKAQRLSATIPRYTLAGRNEVRIAFQRQPTQMRCHDTAMAYPVAILPGSSVHLSKIGYDGDFLGISGQYADGATLLLPAGWLASPETTLPLVIRMADVAGITPDKTTLQLVPAGQNAKPGTAFLALDVGLDGYRPGSVPRSGQLVLRSRDNAPQLDINGVDRLATAEVVQAGGQNGIAFAAVGQHAPQLLAAFRLGRGNLALLADAGPVLQLNTNDPDGVRMAEATRWHWRWDRSMIPWVVAAALLLLLIAARIATLRQRRSRSRLADRAATPPDA
jgi:hypothetical protein